MYFEYYYYYNGNFYLLTLFKRFDNKNIFLAKTLKRKVLKCKDN